MTDALDSSPLEAKLYLAISNVFGSSSDLNQYEYSDGSRSGSILIGDEADPIHVIFSLPLKTADCYLMICDGDPKKLAREVAVMQEYNDTCAHLCFGHTVPTNNQYLNEAGWFYFLITSPKVAHVDFPDTFMVECRKIRMHLALPLTVEHRRVKIEQGLDVLMDQLEKSSRDPMTFHNTSETA